MSEIELCHLQEKTFEFRRVQTVHVNSPKNRDIFLLRKYACIKYLQRFYVLIRAYTH